MSPNHCPACWRANADDALTCSICGTPLGSVDTLRLPLETVPGPKAGGALWLDDLVGPAAGPEPDARPGATPPAVTLRDLDARAAPVEPPRSLLTVPEADLVQSDDKPQSPLLPPLTLRDPAAPSVQQQAADTAQRAERRAAVRRGRRVDASVAAQVAVGAPEVLVVGSPSIAGDPLCVLLRSFGFDVHATTDGADALARAASRSLLASFVHAEMSDGRGGNGIDLCALVRKANARNDGDRLPLLVLVAARLRPIDRVRAELAGCDDAIPIPITRGSVARLLDARGIRLPSDPRQA